MKKINLLALFLFVVGLAGGTMAQFDQSRDGRQASRADRDLIQSELRNRISNDERRNYDVRLDSAETYYLNRNENGIRGRAQISTSRSNWQNIWFEGSIDTRQNIVNNLRWGYDNNNNGGNWGGNQSGNRSGNQSGVLRSGRYEMQLVATSRLLSVGNDGRTVVQSGNGGRYSQWDIEDAGNGYYYIRSADSGDVLTVQGRGDSGDSVVLARQQRGDENQLWLIRSGPDNGYYFLTRRDKSLDSPSSARFDGGRMQIYNSNGEANQRFRLRLIGESDRYSGRDRYDRNSGRDSYDRNPNNGNGRSGVLTWSGRVDDVLLLEIRDRNVRDRIVSGQQAERVRFDFSSSLPNREVNVTADKRRGRGDVRVVEQPSRRNGYTAVIEIRDRQGGAADYEIEVRW